MKNKNPWLVCVKWGALLGVALSIFELVKMVARNVEFEGAKMFDIAIIIVFILLIHAGVKEFKEKYPQRLSFAKAFMACIIISFVGAVLFFGYDLLHYSLIEKDGLAKKYDKALNNFRASIERDTISTLELNAYLDTVKVMMEEQETLVCQENTLSDSIRMDVHRGMQLIERFYDEKMTARRAADTAHNYQMANFAPYARRVLVETLQLYIAQNEKENSTRYVEQVVQQTNSQLATVNPVDARFEQNKSHVPHYDKTLTYVSVSAMMNLLYGMFFGLFVAMFHYRSKNPIEEKAES
ncbi:MAG: DUF4199 domain-containing protein [Bacteroidales bacterium]|nr:DUF4199 domain-containing protein [Bacteroidales bacterium]